MAVEEVAVLPIEGVLDYGSRGGVNKNSVQQQLSAPGSQHSAPHRSEVIAETTTDRCWRSADC